MHNYVHKRIQGLAYHLCIEAVFDAGVILNLSGMELLQVIIGHLQPLHTRLDEVQMELNTHAEKEREGKGKGRRGREGGGREEGGGGGGGGGAGRVEGRAVKREAENRRYTEDQHNHTSNVLACMNYSVQVMKYMYM